ncbi:MAG: hypothetical protein ACPGKS_07950 [Coraliomargarita sp.]
MNNAWTRPKSAADIARLTTDAESFGRNVRDWQHELRNVSTRKEFSKRIEEAPSLLEDKLHDSGQCDAYLAAYVEWLCARHGIETPGWLDDPTRFARKAWYDYPPLWQDSLVHAPAAFRRRGIFTRPEDILKIRRGRPTVSDTQKRAKSAERQRQYRRRVREKLERLKQLEAQQVAD